MSNQRQETHKENLMSDDRSNGRLRKVGAMWRPKAGAKILSSGEITIDGKKHRFIVLPNRHKAAGSNAPDYELLSSDEPEVDSYAQARGPAPLQAERQPSQEDDDESPF
jgi:hypothetical protein